MINLEHLTGQGLSGLYKHAGILLVGNSVKFLLGLVVLALSIKALRTDQFASLVLIQAYTVVVERLFSFQSWQAFITFGTPSLEAEIKEDFKSLVKSTCLLDLSCAVCAGLLAAILACGVGYWKNWELDRINVAVLYSLSLMTHVSGTPIGILKIFDRFKLISLAAVLPAIFKCLATLWAFYQAWTLWGFALIWMVTDAIEPLILLSLAYRELNKQGFKGISRSGLNRISEAHRGIWTFLISSNLESSVKLAWRELDIFWISLFLNVHAVAAYKVVKEICLIPAGLVDAAYRSSYPIMSRLWNEDAHTLLKGYLARTISVGLCLSFLGVVGYLLIGRIFIRAVFGEQFLVIFFPLLVSLLAEAIWLTFFCYSAAALAMGLAHKVLIISTACSLISVLFQLVLIPTWGIIGASLSHIIFRAIWTIGGVRIVDKQLEGSMRVRQMLKSCSRTSEKKWW